MQELLRRRWACAPLSPARAPDLGRVVLRSSSPEDDRLLVELLDASYRGTIDFDPKADHRAELDTWRTHDRADDAASVVALADGQLVGACLIGHELGSPLLYEVIVAPPHRRSGLARALLTRSLSVLHDRGEESSSAWVTHGNEASEALLRGAGFTPVTPPVARDVAIGYYRAAALAATLPLKLGAVVAASSEASGPILWIIDESGPSNHQVIGEVSVQVERLALDDPRTAEIAETAMPIRRVAWLLSRRRHAPPVA
jgi:ribosomal protein S18 acetylase RimI-like enzyme